MEDHAIALVQGAVEDFGQELTYACLEISFTNEVVDAVRTLYRTFYQQRVHGLPESKIQKDYWDDFCKDLEMRITRLFNEVKEDIPYPTSSRNYTNNKSISWQSRMKHYPRKSRNNYKRRK